MATVQTTFTRAAPQFLQGHLLLDQLCCARFDFFPPRGA
jgi:hypothetical protein